MAKKTGIEREIWYKAWSMFYNHFGYDSNIPDKVAFEDDKVETQDYIETLTKSVKDNFDYTIEKYGTVIPLKGDWSKKEVVID